MEDLGYFLVDCEEFQGGRRLLLDRGAGEWVDFFGSGGKEGKVLLFLVERWRVDEKVQELVGVCVMRCVGECPPQCSFYKNPRCLIVISK